ncbi:MAG: dienelactone hydrolase family protein [Cephaloticoccus sp.]|nr:dienelactone hydrolase family protein [Cephaloticoccus sp.]MCF7759499.1 dienelactone hydrolase family protein [Cephaloticoccus sp.]
MSSAIHRPRSEPEPIRSSWDDLLEGVHSPADWLVRKAELRQRYLELIRDEHKPAKPPLDLRVHETVDVDGLYERRLISYAVEADERAHAFLAIPHGLTGPAPALVSVHGTYAHGKEREAGLEENPEKAFLDHLARRGYVVIAPDHFVAGERIPPEGAYDTTRFYLKHPEWTAVGKANFEHAIAIDVLQSLSCVDPGRIGTLGHSLGGHGAYFLAAYDSRISVAVSNSGCAPFRYNHKVEAWARDHFYIYLKPMRAGLLRGELPPIDMHEIMALIAPRPFLDLSALNDLIMGDDPQLAGWTYRQRVLMLMKVMDAYELEGAAVNFSFYAHGQGHAAPYEARQLMYGWLDKHLKEPAATRASLVQDNRFVNHGICAAVSESRGVAAVRDAQGRDLLLTLLLDLNPLGSILVTDLGTGETRQVWFPESTRSEVWAKWAPYASLLSRNGRFYTFAGNTLLEFDVDRREFTFHGVPSPDESCYVETALADGPDGRIYAASHPHARLVSYDPLTREMCDHGQLDPNEQYPNSLAVDAAGWLYAGIGTARWNLVAFNPATSEICPLLTEAERGIGSARVFVGTDGSVYGVTGDSQYRLHHGQLEPVAAGDLPVAKTLGAGRFQNREAGLADGRRVTCHLPERLITVTDSAGGAKRDIVIKFQSGGAIITTLGSGPGGRIYGSTAHPMHFFEHDLARRETVDHGAIKAIGGGNICALARQGNLLVGPAYPWGDFYCYDPALPFAPESPTVPNPRVLVRFERHITRPRTCLAHPDGVHVIAAGFMDYGHVGGGLGIVDLQTGESTLLTHDRVVPGHSTHTIKALPSGDLVGGTSVLAPGGGHTTAREGVLYLLDWSTRQVVFQTVPVPGAAEVFSLEVGGNGLVYGLTTGSQFFVFDPQKRAVVHHADLAPLGDLVRPALAVGAGGTVYGVLSRTVFRIEPDDHRITNLGESPVPITAGLAILDGRIYFGSQAQLWSCRL